MSTPKEFRARMKQLGALVQERSDALAQGTARTLANEMMTGGKYSPGTPIRDGFHRSHWDAEIGGIPAGGSIGGEDAPNPEAAAARVETAVATMVAGDTINITNNGPAIRRLEFGFVGTDSAGRVYTGFGPNSVGGRSNQAPDGFVRPAAEAIQQIVDEVAEFVVSRGA